MSTLRVGIGVDAHAFEDGVPLVLGGLAFEHPRGLAGHSDGNVVTHAVQILQREDNLLVVWNVDTHQTRHTACSWLAKPPKP